MTHLAFRCCLTWLVCAAAAVSIASAQPPAAFTESILHNFPPASPKGAYPYGGVIRDEAGNLYGTTNYGGIYGAGTVYKAGPGGHEKVLYSFTGGTDGNAPYGDLVHDSAGNLYGTTLGGGNLTPAACTYEGSPEYGGCGVVFKLDPSGQETLLYTFTGGADGALPSAGVIRDVAGNLYGTTQAGGPANAGVVFKVTPSGQEIVLHGFTGGADGGTPLAGLIADSAGNLYGTTRCGGSGTVAYCEGSGAGVVFRVDPAGNETVLYSFTGGSDGAFPQAPVMRDSSGGLYGTTSDGGASNLGTVYKLDASGHETVLHSFAGGTDGQYPVAGLTRDASGNLYGTTLQGGGGKLCYWGSLTTCGVVFKIDPAGRETILYAFTGGTTGGRPQAGVTLDSSGNLYGTASLAGVGNNGVVFKLDPSGQQTILYGFPAGTDGAEPRAGVAFDSSGNLYGTTSQGGTWNSGSVYKRDPSGHETVLYSFMGGADGGFPTSGVIVDAAGNLCGTADGGNAIGAGVVFKVDPSGHETVLYTFTGGADGSEPWGGLTRDSVGNLYGTTILGGSANVGVVFKVTPSGHETVLHTFTGAPDGFEPESGVIRDSDGNLYGTTSYGGSANWGTVFKIDPAGQETILYNFTGGADGGAVLQGVVRDAAGNLYGATYGGGINPYQGNGYQGCGVVYKLDTSGDETVLHTFTCGPGGGNPISSVIRDSAGNLYGTAPSGGDALGTVGKGVVYKVDPTGNETVLFTFMGDNEGGVPYGGLVRDGAGNLYGTTVVGGEQAGGVIFKLTPQ